MLLTHEVFGEVIGLPGVIAGAGVDIEFLAITQFQAADAVADGGQDGGVHGEPPQSGTQKDRSAKARTGEFSAELDGLVGIFCDRRADFPQQAEDNRVVVAEPLGDMAVAAVQL